MTLRETRQLLTPEVRRLLQRFAVQGAFLPGALESAGVPTPLVRAMLAVGPPERARIGLDSRRRELAQRYVWGPDVAGYVRGWSD